MLPEINRRQMLIATGTALTCSYRLVAAENIRPVSFVIVSDTHLGRKDNLSAEKNWRAAIEEINTLPGEFVLHLGDVVDGGRPAQYPIYAETRKLLNKPIHEIPGNHDPVDLFRKHVSKQIDRIVDAGPLRLLLFNNAHRDSHDGFITDQQIAWLDEQITAGAEASKKMIICCHVPIHSNTHPDRGWYVKPDQGQTAFYALRRKYSEHILACFHGHFHNGIRGWREHGETVETLLPSVCYNQNRNLQQHLADGKATGFFVNELRPGYVLAEIGNGLLKLKYKPLGAELHGEYQAQWS